MSKGNTAVKKLMGIAKRHWIRRNLGTSARFRDDVLNRVSVVMVAPTMRLAVRSRSPVRADYVRHAGKWKHL